MFQKFSLSYSNGITVNEGKKQKPSSVNRLYSSHDDFCKNLRQGTLGKLISASGDEDILIYRVIVYYNKSKNYFESRADQPTIKKFNKVLILFFYYNL